jgi:sucrose-phosphate synthase
MRGDSIVVEEHHIKAAAKIVKIVTQLIEQHHGKYTIFIAGESGCGKSETATALATALSASGKSCLILQQDDYFVYPPRTNDQTRRLDIGWVGPQEVRLDLLDGHLQAFREGASIIEKPLVIYFSFTGHSLGAQKIDKLGVRPENAARMEETFRFSKRIHAERLSMERASTIVTSTGQERFEQYSHPLYAGAVDVTDDARFAVIPPGVNTYVFSSDKETRDEEVRDRLMGRVATSREPCIIVSSRLEAKKNIGGVVSAYVSSKALQDRARLVIVIRGVEEPYTDISTLPESEKEVLRPILETIEGAQLKDRIDFLDIRSQQDLASVYRVLARCRSVFALTSFHEPFGLAPIEAAACGLAVVATRNGGPSEIFVDEAGVLVDPTDVEDIARGLLKALEHYERYAERGQGRVAEKYTWHATAGRYLEVIQRGAVQTQGLGRGVPELDCAERTTDYLGSS